jgi:hypothetical protein
LHLCVIRHGEAAGLYANGPDGQSIREQLVLLLRHDPQALAVAEWHVWEILPECRGCGCR